METEEGSSNPCQGCSRCCRYVSVEIPKPDNPEDLDIAIWYLYHGHKIFVDADGFYLQVDRDCKYLNSEGRCGIYENRPVICRDYDVADCEQNKPGAYWRIFSTAEELKEFVSENPKCEIKNIDEK